MSEAVERRIWEMLDRPTKSPYGNPIPGLAALGGEVPVAGDRTRSLADVASRMTTSGMSVLIRRIDEPLQTEHDVMASLRRAGAVPGSTVQITRAPRGLLVGSGGEYVEVSLGVAEHISVESV